MHRLLLLDADPSVRAMASMFGDKGYKTEDIET
jgi:hypothetical protein